MKKKLKKKTIKVKSVAEKWNIQNKEEEVAKPE